MLRTLFFVILTLGLALSAQAQMYPSLYVDADSKVVRESTTGPLSASWSEPYKNFSQSISASADYGVIKLFADLSTASEDASSGLYSVANAAAFYDTFVIDAPGLTGTNGTVSVTYSIDGAFTLAGLNSPDMYIASELNVRLAGSDAGVIDNPQYTRLINGTEGGTNFLGAPRTLTANFVFGQPIYLAFSLSTAVNWVSGLDLSSHGAADLGNSAYWGGITAVTTSGGTTVEDFTTISDSGANYASPIPEPSTAAMLALVAGLGMVVLVRRRTRP